MSEKWQFSERALTVKASIIRETLKFTQMPGVISFAGGLPAPELFPIGEILAATQRVLKQHGRDALQYSPTEGYPPLRQLIADRLARQGVKVSIDEILITGGSQQGLDLCGNVFLDVGSPLICARPTYLGAIQAFSGHLPRFITLESDDGGMMVDKLEEVITKNKPRLIYLVPTFQNPDGRMIPLERREKIIALARKYEVPIIEDDPYSELCFEGTVPPLMKALAPECTIILGTFSKLLAPGLRVAWLIAPRDTIDKFVRMKQGADLHTNTFAQYVVYEFAKDGRLDAHIARIREPYAKRRNAMVDAMKRYFPPEVKFTSPSGGLFLWVELPERYNVTELLPRAVEKKVAYIPGSAFYPDGSGHNSMRLNFSKPTVDEIEEGIKRLGEMFKETLTEK